MRSILLLFFIFSISLVQAQNDLLAKNYFNQGEYEKALSLYTKLYKKTKRYDYFNALVATNQQLENYSEAERLLKEKLNSPRINPKLYVELGYNYALQEKDSLATLNYQKAIESIGNQINYARSIGETFEKFSLLNQAVITYENAMKLNPEMDYNYQLARLYGEQGNLERMFKSYLNLIKKNRAYKGIAQRNFSLYVTEDPSNEGNILLRKALLQKLQKQPDVMYNELLSWLFIQQKDYKKAFTQEKAIYKRMGDDNLTGIADIAYIAIEDKDYENAKIIVDYIIENAPNNETKIEGYQQLMKIKIKTSTKKEYPKIEKKYEALLDEFGRGKKTYKLQISYNYFLAFELNKKEKAISNLKTLSKQKLSRFQNATVKMVLADILVLDEKFNQALIYYSQVQNEVKGTPIAQEARFKVAKTSYFKGDFEWAQVQLNVLKKSATQLIANDAMQLSLLIKDNSLEDSTQTALKQYARADLMAFQKRETEAIKALEGILENHKGEKIEDEALLKMGELYEIKREYKKAEASYLKLIQFYNEDILADDAHYRLAKLYETKLGLPEKAKQYYEQIIFNFEDSIYFVEARKKFRMLRGDEIE
ncbi:MAG: tetratricopeptide repeat protein [Flavobacteriaceae bacterium]|nr:tetratricopeptide repeat protein [Flavobacteriaceae bacterium]